MEEGSAGDDAEFVGFDAHGLGECDGVGGDAAGVAFGLLVAEIERIAHGFEGDVVAALEVLHGGAQAAGAGGDDRFQVLAVDGVLFSQAAMLDAALDNAFQLGAVEGLEKIVDGSATKGVGDHVDVVDGGEDDDWQRRVVHCYLVEEGEAVDVGHHDVGEDEVVVGVLREAGEGLFGACGGGSGVAVMFKHGGGYGANGFFVVDDEDSFLGHGGVFIGWDGGILRVVSDFFIFGAEW